MSVSRKTCLQRGILFPLTATEDDRPSRPSSNTEADAGSPQRVAAPQPSSAGAASAAAPRPVGSEASPRRGGRRCRHGMRPHTGRTERLQRPAGPARAGDARPRLPLWETEPRPARRRRSAPPRASSASSWRPRGGGGRARPLSRRNAPSRPARWPWPGACGGEGGGKEGGRKRRSDAAAARYASSRSGVRRAQPQPVPASRPQINGRGLAGLRMRTALAWGLGCKLG